MRTIEVSDQRFRWVPRIWGSRTIEAPSATRRVPSSMSSIAGSGYRAASNPPAARKASRRIAPSPAQKVSAGPGELLWT